MPATSADLSTLFNRVTRALEENEAALNQADTLNHNHGTNMVQNFQTITQAVRQERYAPPSAQLQHASRVLSQESSSGSGQMYAQNLDQAARQMQGQPAITPENIIGLLQALLGARAGASPTASQPYQGGAGQVLPPTGAGSDPLSDLINTVLGGAGGGQSTSQQPPASGSGGIDLNTLLTAGSAYMRAHQQGASPMQALAQAIVAGSRMNSTPHRAQSGELVAGTLINAASQLFGGQAR